MAINNVNNPGLSLAQNLGAKKTEKAAINNVANAYAKTASNSLKSEAANVQISSKAKEMNQAMNIVNETPDIRADKVAYFKDLLAKGEYKADAGKIADGIFREAAKDALSSTPDIALE